MNSLFKSKSFWSGIGLIVTGAATIATTGNIPVGLLAIGQGLAAIFQRNATAKADDRVAALQADIKQIKASV